MRTFLSCLFVLVSVGGSALAQVTPGIIPGGSVSARDGFTKSGTEILLTRNGVSQKLEKEIVMENGLRVRPDGTVTLPAGQQTMLRDNQLLTLAGSFESAAISPEGTAPVSSVVTPLKKVGEEVGVSATDGVSISSGSVLVTRNGVTERLGQELKLANGTRVQPNGTVNFPDGKQVMIRVNQVLTFDGLLLENPIRPTPAPAAPRDGGAASPGVNPTTVSPQ